jgi:hypothetical protein
MNATLAIPTPASREPTRAGGARPAPSDPAGPPKLSAAALRRAQRETLAAPRFDYDPLSRALFAAMDLVYGAGRSLAKFRALEVIARVPYQARERLGYAGVTAADRRGSRRGRAIFDRIVRSRAQEDNEQWHLFILEELTERAGVGRGAFRYRLLPWLLASLYYPLCELLYARFPGLGAHLNARFEDHAEHEYMLFVAEHPELEAQPWESDLRADYGDFASLADLFRQIGHDERVHKLESLADA